jgi:hypothetical protein
MPILRITRHGSFFAFLSSFLFLLFLSSSVPAATQEVEAIRQAIREKGARWLADETSITKLPGERRLKRVGLIRPVGVSGGSVLESTLPVAPPGSTYVNYNDYGFVTPIRDQGDCGSCWAFSTTAALESQVLIASSGAGASSLDLSEETLISCCGAQACGDCNGGYIYAASNFIESTGLPQNSCFPYPLTNYDNYYSTHGQTMPPVPACSASACPSWKSYTDAIKGWNWVAVDFWTVPDTAPIPPTVANLKNALYNFGPLVVAMNVYSDFYSYSQGVYSYVGPRFPDGQPNTFQGAHAIELIGYDDDNQCFIAKNSWGTGWGEGGFFRIDYNEVYNQASPSDQNNGAYQYLFGAETIAYDGYKPVQTACSYTISPQSITVTYAGGNANATVSSQSGCSWTAVSNVDWISAASGANRTANGTVTYNVKQNTTTASRSGTLTIAGETLSVTQTGEPVPRVLTALSNACSSAISPQSITVSYAGGYAKECVSSPSGCSWTAESDVSWIEVISGASGTGKGTVEYYVFPNHNYAAGRTGRLTIGGEVLTVTQPGMGWR